MKRLNRWLLFITGLILLGLTFSSPLSSYGVRSIQHGWQLGHVLLFIVWTYSLVPALAQRIPRVQTQFMIVIVATLFAGLVIEYLQTFIGRDFSLRDLLFDLNGSLLALCVLIGSGTLLIHKWPRRILYALTTLLSCYATAPLAVAVVDEINMKRNFPVLADFDNQLEAGRWNGRVALVKLLSEKGDDRVLRVLLSTDHYSGAALIYFHRDWYRYRQLQFELFNPGQTPLPLTIRIHDRLHYSLGNGDYDDRFNRQLTMEPGWNNIAIELEDVAEAPAKRTMDLANIQAFGFFSTDLPKARIIYIDKLRLTR